ncbi:hypothetical protein SAMN05880582_101600 [Rhizobium sp. RU20A]|uniref:hypothetical protein n=1 Tax=Rhizobium sp. RU20A TaxID=1907412 RepID=UPI000953C345|nr:hypothetical protein [Rhizobium sp. RU20A]SIQ06738.1 hypothetical protein SAMN05880582_101600 [Rhizobium sp. RU20A]
MRNRLAAVFTGFVTGACLTAAAFDPARAEETAQDCPRNARYVVVAEAHAEAPGERFAVFRIGKSREFTPCRFDAARASFIVGKPGDPLWYSALKDNLLIMTRSTGPDGDLVVVDLDRDGKTVLDVPANSFDVGETSLTYRERTGVGSAATCPEFAEHQANGFGSALTVEKTLDLRTFATTETGRTGCEATQ